MHSLSLGLGVRLTNSSTRYEPTPTPALPQEWGRERRAGHYRRGVDIYQREKTCERHSVLLLAAVCMAVLGGCATGDVLGGFNLISESKEYSLGTEIGAQIERDMGVVEDPAVQAYVREIGRKLVAVSLSSDKPYQFVAVRDEEVNAFAIPGWRLYVHSGLIEAAKDEAQLAAVMAHEIGHAEKRHGTQQLSRQMGAQFLLGIALGNEQTDTARIANLITNTGILSYSRSAEMQADEIAVHLLHRSGYDPRALPEFFEILLQLNPGEPRRATSLFSTHPETRERIAVSRDIISRLAPKTYVRGDTARFKAVQRALQSR